MMNYREAREYLKQVNKYGSVLGLDSIKRLLGKLGNPQDSLKVVHVAGTNGKGSTLSFLQNILMEAGYNVGRYSSPSVFDYREIIRFNDNFIEENILAEIITIIKEKCDEITGEGFSHPTPFEIETAMAFMYFNKKKCDIVLIECGMGGETDATNVFENVLCSVITTISLEHMNFLGDTISKITRVKAGIIKNGCPVVMSNQNEEAIKVVSEIAKSKDSILTVTGIFKDIELDDLETLFVYKASNGENYHIKLKTLGTYQIINSITAVEVALVLENQGFYLKTHIEKGIYNTLWQGRLEIINNAPMIVIDGAHNPGAVEELKRSIDFYFTNKRITFIMGVLADKDFEREVAIICNRAEKIITVTPNNPRALSAKELAKTISGYKSNVVAANSIKEAVEKAVSTINNNESDMVLAFGSLSYLGDLKETIKEQTVKAERRD